MKTRVLRDLVIASFLASLLGCSNPRAEPAPATVAAATRAAPNVIVVPVPKHPGTLQPEAGPPTICKLGQSCMALDSRPFEPCLLSTTHCKDKVRETLLVDRPAEPVAPPAVIETSVGAPADAQR